MWANATQLSCVLTWRPAWKPIKLSFEGAYINLTAERQAAACSQWTLGGPGLQVTLKQVSCSKQLDPRSTISPVLAHYLTLLSSGFSPHVHLPNIQCRVISLYLSCWVDNIPPSLSPDSKPKGNTYSDIDQNCVQKIIPVSNHISTNILQCFILESLNTISYGLYLLFICSYSIPRRSFQLPDHVLSSYVMFWH